MPIYFFLLESILIIHNFPRQKYIYSDISILLTQSLVQYFFIFLVTLFSTGVRQVALVGLVYHNLLGGGIFRAPCPNIPLMFPVHLPYPHSPFTQPLLRTTGGKGQQLLKVYFTHVNGVKSKNCWEPPWGTLTPEPLLMQEWKITRTVLLSSDLPNKQYDLK